MKRSEHARMLVGLTMPGSGPAAGAAAVRVPCFPEQRWLAVKGTLTRALSWSREHSLDGAHAVYWLTLLACCSLLGLIVGGYVGFIEAAAPAVDAPGRFVQLAASDPQWAAMAKQEWLASHPFDSAGVRVRETHWQRLMESAVTDCGPGGRPSPTMFGRHFVHLDAPVAGRVPRSPNHEVEFGERTSSRTVTDR